MIYSKWGSQLKITGYCGEHQPKGFAAPVCLVKAMRLDDRAERFYFASTLKADDGASEIVDAIDRAPQIILSKSTLKSAVRQAM